MRISYLHRQFAMITISIIVFPERAGTHLLLNRFSHTASASLPEASEHSNAGWFEKAVDSVTTPEISSASFGEDKVKIQARHGDEEGVIQTLKDMKHTGCQCSSMLDSLLQAYKKTERMEFNPSILENSFYEDILPDLTACSILVVAYVQKALLEEALQVLNSKKWEDSKFEENLYHLLICSFKEESQHENAIKCYHQMPKSEHRHNLQITCTMIDIYSASNNFIDAENLYFNLKESGISFDMIAYSIVVRMHMKSGSWRNACLVLDAMEKENSIAPDTSFQGHAPSIPTVRHVGEAGKCLLLDSKGRSDLGRGDVHLRHKLLEKIISPFRS